MKIALYLCRWVSKTFLKVSCSWIWEDTGPTEPTVGEFVIHGANKGKIHIYLSNPTLQPQEAACSSLKCKSMSFCAFVYVVPSLLLIPSMTLWKYHLRYQTIHTNTPFLPFCYLPDSIQVSVKDPVNSVANTCLHVCIPYQILSSLLGGMYCIFICPVPSTVSSSYQMVRNCFWKETRKDKRKE